MRSQPRGSPVRLRAGRERGRSRSPRRGRRRRTATASDAVSGLMPPSTWIRNGRSRERRICVGALHLRKVLGHERLAAEPRRDRHHEQQVDPLVQVGLDRLERRRPVDHDPGLHPELADPPEQRRRVAELHVHAAQVGARLRELLEPEPRVGHHQVAVQEQVGVPADRRDHGRPDRQVGHEMPVHQVHVEPVALGPDPLDLLREHGVVGREDRGGEQDVVRHRRSLPHPRLRALVASLDLPRPGV